MRHNRVLWNTDYRSPPSCEGKSFDELLDDASARPTYESVPRLCANALVVVQEIALTGYLLERHNVALLVESGRFAAKLAIRIDQSSQLMCVALFIVVYFSSRAERAPSQKKSIKVRQRLVDGILLACLLRFMSSLLRSLTASYSSDTVQFLVIAGVLLHLFACDYSYANGQEPLVVASRQRRPPFQGGTISLNAALFSTILLVSRLRSNASAFFLVCVSIVLFAFFPVTRSAISASYPVHSSRKFELRKESFARRVPFECKTYVCPFRQSRHVDHHSFCTCGDSSDHGERKQSGGTAGD
jgi:Phosphatidylinositol N-acetylglucosaminyltransferase